MSFSNDLNLLAANNVIGYDTYGQTLSGMGMRAGGYNPFGVGKLNTGARCDTFCPTNVSKKAGIGAACGFTIGAFITNAFRNASKTKSGKQTLLQTFQNGLGIKTRARGAKGGVKAAKHAAKAAQKGFKGVLSKLGKTCKTAAIVAGVGAIAASGIKLYQAAKMRSMPPLDLTGRPQENDQTMYPQNNNQEAA